VRRLAVAVVVVAALGSSEALAVRTICTTRKALKVSLKKPDKSTAWVVLPTGTLVEIRARAKDWSEVGTVDGFARAASIYLDAACALPPMAPAGTRVAKKSEPKPAVAKPEPTKPEPVKPEPPVVAVLEPPTTTTTTPTTTPEPAVVRPQEPLPEPPAAVVDVARWVVPDGVKAPDPTQPEPSADDTITGVPSKAWLTEGAVYEELDITDIGHGVGRRLVAVVDLKANAGAEKLSEALTTVLNADLGAREGLRSISRNEVKSVIEHQADAQLTGCASVNCAADLAKLLDAELVVAGTLDVIEEARVLSVSLIDPSVPQVLTREQIAWHDDPDEMISAIRPVVDRLLAGAGSAQLEGSLEVFAQAGTTVVVDGVEAGVTPLPAPLFLPVGVHRVLLSQSGYESQSRDAAVAQKENSILRAELVEEPFYTQWWFWTATGGGLLVAGSVAVGVTTYGVLENAKNQPPRLVVGAKE
jgi:hypothetical protein